ncbi:hypothetical protein [Microbacterium sp. CGR1]|nr:hypothetical protein [Microbacterium sp. CGR1]
MATPATITVHNNSSMWYSLANASNLYIVFADGDGNLHAVPNR